MMKLKKFACLLTILMLPLLLSACLAMKIQDHYRMFDSIQECKQIGEGKNAEITQYESPTADKHWRSFDYLEFYGIKYHSEEFSFELFAYEFSSTEVAGQYYKAITGRDPAPEFKMEYSQSGGDFKSELVVRNESKAYSILASTRDMEAVKQYLTEIFTIDVAAAISDQFESLYN